MFGYDLRAGVRLRLISPEFFESCESFCFQMLEVGGIRYRRFKFRADGLTELAGEARNKLVPLADFLNECFHIPLFPVATLIAHLDSRQLSGLDEFENPDYAQVAPQEMLHAAKLRIAGILRLAERTPRPALPGSPH